MWDFFSKCHFLTSTQSAYPAILSRKISSFLFAVTQFCVFLLKKLPSWSFDRIDQYEMNEKRHCKISIQTFYEYFLFDLSFWKKIQFLFHLRIFFRRCLIKWWLKCYEKCKISSNWISSQSILFLFHK